MELLAATYVGRDLASYAEAIKSVDAKQWNDTCQYEIDTLHKNDTWELVDLPPGQKSIKSKWVFKLKADGHYCACLVAKGFMQIPGIDYNETFSPIAHFESLRLLLSWKWHVVRELRWYVEVNLLYPLLPTENAENHLVRMRCTITQ